MFTAVAVLQLVEGKKFSLDDRVGKYLLDFVNLYKSLIYNRIPRILMAPTR